MPASLPTHDAQLSPDLIDLAKAGDREALERLLTAIAPMVRRFGMRMCQDAHDSEDVLQETLLDILLHLPSFEGRSSFSSWVFSLTRSRCTRRRRGQKNQPKMPLHEIPEPTGVAPSPEEVMSVKVLGRTLDQALGRLSEEHREVLLLRDVESLTAPEAAEILGISVMALKSRLHRARAALREALDPNLLRPTSSPGPSCPDIAELWSRKLDGELDALDCEHMERHLLTCPACTEACAALKNALFLCRTHPVGDVSPEIQHAVKSAVRIWLRGLEPASPR
jgi:RNA polymerase sigma-70 factor, ECF subfamily